MGNIIIVMMHNPPEMVEPLQGTEWSSIHKSCNVNDFYMVAIISQITPRGSLMASTTRFIKWTEAVLSSWWGHIELANAGVCRDMICDIANESVNHLSSAHWHIRKGGYTGRDSWKGHSDNSKNTLEQ